MAAGDTQITITGNLVEDPELRSTPAGQPVARFRPRAAAATVTNPRSDSAARCETTGESMLWPSSR